MSQILQICGSGLHKSENKNEKKTNGRHKAERETEREKQKFLAFGDLLRSSKKVFIESNSLFLAR